MGLTVVTGDARAAQIMGAGMTFGDFWGVDASVANGAQPIAQFFDREGTAPLRLVRGTSGTTNIVAKDQVGADCFVQVQSGTTLTASATVVV